MSRSRKNFKKLALTFALGLTLTLTACGTSNDNRMQNRSPASANRASPAAMLGDIFQVHRPLPEHEKNNTEFYFKRCEASGNHWPESATAYDCSYP
ncbi:MAG: hypothetical protein ABL927_01510 [Bdellovibrionales bacterium]